MAQRFRQRYLESGDVIDGRDWNLNHAEFIQEWNGYLDRDNLPSNAITEGLVVANAFNQITSDGYTAGAADFVVDVTSLGWQVVDASSNEIGRLNITPDVDALLICEFGGWHQWQGNNWSVLLHSNATGIGASPAERGVEDCIRYRLTVDGTIVADSGWQSDAHRDGTVYLCGAVPVTAGTRLVQVECEVAGVRRYPWSDSGSTEELLQALRNVTILDRELIVHMRKR